MPFIGWLQHDHRDSILRLLGRELHSDPTNLLTAWEFRRLFAGEGARFHKVSTFAAFGHRVALRQLSDVSWFSSNALLCSGGSTAPLHDDDHSRARFPSKIADYLMSSQPVVTCSVGEGAEYLADRETAFFIQTDHLREFAAKIRHAITCPEREAVARRGRRLAEEVFDSRVARPTIARFPGVLDPGWLSDWRFVRDW